MIEEQEEQLPEAIEERDEVKLVYGSVEDSRYGKLRATSIESEMKQSYLDYAMSVIVARALPDVRDGMKPVHRRILYSMYKSGIHHSSSYKKSARIVGDVLGKYHPHGDAPVYMALVRLAQNFSMRYQLIDGQGNFGSVDGDSPAAMRYTEARLARISSEMLGDLDKETVPMGDNFDGSLKEPMVLPAKLPNLLLMGSEGIAVGMATKIPPHNLTEVCQAILLLLKTSTAKVEKAAVDPKQTQAELIEKLSQSDPKELSGVLNNETTIDEIMQIIKGPDFPTGGIMYDFQAISEGYRTGKGRVVTRAKAEIVENNKGFQIIVTELPYQVNKARLLMKIADLVRDKKIVGIRDLNDDSDRKGMQITIELKRDVVPKVVLNKLFKYSELQTSFPMNMVALNSEGTPQLMNIRQILLEYLAHRQVIIVRRTQYDLVAAGKRAHILEGLLIALKNLDDVIDTIRKSPDTEVAKTQLMKKFGLSELQAVAILEMQLKRLAALERQKIEDEYKQIQEAIGKLLVLLQDPQAILSVIAQETEELISLYGDERKTKLVKGKIGEMSEEDLIPNEPTVITLTQTGYIKRLNPTSFRSQSRGGKGSIGVKMKDEDVVQSLMTAQTHDTLLMFTNLGRVFKLKAHEIPESQRQAKGTAVVNLLSLKGEEVVRSLLIIDEAADGDKFISLATRKGLIKKTAVKLFSNIRQNGIIAIMLNDDDQLVWGKLTSGKDDILLITHEGKCIRFGEDQVKTSQRDTKGVKGITLKASDYVVDVEAITEALEKTDHLLVITENGMGKRTPLSQYPTQKRSGLGVKVSDITKRTGAVAAALRVDESHEEVVISTREGQTIKLPLTKKSIPVLTRPTQGVILMRLKETDGVVAVALTIMEAE
ncbi:MAG: DNA gyrase subunit A [bacterium]|nr:DNA gyrase subunit A [bacterium]